MLPCTETLLLTLNEMKQGSSWTWKFEFISCVPARKAFESLKDVMQKYARYVFSSTNMMLAHCLPCGWNSFGNRLGQRLPN